MKFLDKHNWLIQYSTAQYLSLKIFCVLAVAKQKMKKWKKSIRWKYEKNTISKTPSQRWNENTLLKLKYYWRWEIPAPSFTLSLLLKREILCEKLFSDKLILVCFIKNQLKTASELSIIFVILEKKCAIYS